MSIIIAATITPDIKKWLDEKAEKDDRTVSRIIRRILQKAMDNEKDPVSIDLENN